MFLEPALQCNVVSETLLPIPTATPACNPSNYKLETAHEWKKELAV